MPGLQFKGQEAMIYNYLVKDGPNIGDNASSPVDYFNADSVKRDIRNLQEPSYRPGDIIVIGGGGMATPSWSRQLERHLAKPRKHWVVAWGIGHNHTNSTEYPEWLKDVDLIGVRDYGREYPWVPCASCLSPLFDELREMKPVRKYVMYPHAHMPIPFSEKSATNEDFKTLDTALQYLALGEVVVTTSYHGVYWATLLGRRAIAYPVNLKFTEMRHPAEMLNPDQDWRGHEGKGYPEALDECREANWKFWTWIQRVCT